MSNPIFDDTIDIEWNIDPKNPEIMRECQRHWKGSDISFWKTKRGYIARMYRPDHNDVHAATAVVGNIPVWAWTAMEGFWEKYVVPHIIPETMINMDGEFDGDDIELAQIIIDELEELEKAK